MPAEWEKHSATQLNWPSNRETWPGERLERVEKVYVQIIKALHSHEPIHLFVADTKIEERVTQLLKDAEIDLSQVIIHNQPINDVWARDCGPIFVKNAQNEFVLLDWDYNAWGEKYPPFDADNYLPTYVADTFRITRIKPGMVLEGGAIEVNGAGVLLTTESVLLNKNRNPQLTKSEIEDRLKKYLGLKQIIWLKDGLEGDDTDGHIDDITRFLNKDTVLTMVCEDENDVNYKALKENLEILESVRLSDGSPLKIEKLHLPQTKIEGTTVDGSEYVPASYANFYIANGVVLLPLYDERYDQQAIDLLSKYFPDRKVVGIPCADLVWGQGSIHCITQQWYGI
ncbi:MAG: agmatine deiminase family protein [Balneolaceae bacterium]